MIKRIVAVVPMRHNSERVTGKNYRALAGVPLYHHIVNALLRTPAVDEIVIDTDSDVITEDAALHFPEVRVVPRAPHLRDGSVPMTEVLLGTLETIQADLILQTHSTSPFLRPQTLQQALREFVPLHAAGRFDSMFSVTRLQVRLWDEHVNPINHDPSQLIRTQDLPPLYEENSSFFAFPPELLRTTGRRIGSKPLLFETDRLESLDIDTEEDFRLAEAIAPNMEVLR